VLKDYVFTFPRLNNCKVVLKPARMPSSFSLDMYIGNVDNKSVPGTYAGLTAEVIVGMHQIGEVLEESQEGVNLLLARDLLKVLKGKDMKRLLSTDWVDNLFELLARLLGVIVCAEGARNYVVRGSQHSAEIGFWTQRAFWGNGIATKAVRQIVRFGFERLDLPSVEAKCFTQNIAAGRVLEKNGFHFQGKFRPYSAYLSFCPVLNSFRLLRNEPRVWRAES